MTTHRDWATAMLAEPDDDLVRLAFADWLEEHGEWPRAEWVRLSLQPRVALLNDPAWPHVSDRAGRALRGCLPSYWKGLPQITVESDRGLVRLGLRTPSDARRLGGVSWLQAAAQDGWFGPVTFDCYAVETRLLDAIEAAWAKRAHGLPIAFRFGLREGTVEQLLRVLHLPTLYELWVPTVLFETKVLAALAGHPGLRGVVLQLRSADQHAVHEAAAALRAVPYLRRLTLRGGHGEAGPWLSPASVEDLAANPGLRTLRYDNPKLAHNGALDRMESLRPHLVIEQERDR